MTNEEYWTAQDELSRIHEDFKANALKDMVIEISLTEDAKEIKKIAKEMKEVLNL